MAFIGREPAANVVDVVPSTPVQCQWMRNAVNSLTCELRDVASAATGQVVAVHQDKHGLADHLTSRMGATAAEASALYLHIQGLLHRT